MMRQAEEEEEEEEEGKEEDSGPVYVIEYNVNVLFLVGCPYLLSLGWPGRRGGRRLKARP